MPDAIQRSFTSGEIAPGLRSRADLVKFTTGLAKCENFLVRAQGGVYSRPGFKFIGEVGDSATAVRLIPFSFSTEQTYVLVFQNNTIRIIKNGGFVLSGGLPYEVTTTYTTAQLPYIGFTQSADVMTLVHPDHPPRNLNRLADDNWTLTDINFASTVTAPTGLASVAVGTGAGSYNKTYEYVVTAVNADGVESLASSSTSINTPSLSSTAGVKLTWTAVVGADYYRVYKTTSENTDIYGWIGDSNNNEFTDYNLAPLSSDAPPTDRQPFNGAGNKPSTVNYYQQRLVFANTTNEPQTVYTTQVANYSSLRKSVPSRDDDAVTFTVAGQQVNEIRHLISLDALILLTSSGAWKVTEGSDQVFTPSTVGVRAQGYNGASWVKPAVINDSVVFVQSKGSRIRDLNYEYAIDKYNGSDLSVMSEHLFEGYTITDIAYSAEPYSILWCVRSDGVLLGLTYLREHQVWGWHKHTTDGEFESVTTISEDDRDALYTVVKRTINGSTVRYIERLEKRITDAVENCFYVDSGLSYNGAPVTVISGLDHLEGEGVVALADGNMVEGLTVTSGSITLARAASVVHVGLSYTPRIQTLDIDTSLKSVGMTKAKEVSVSQVTLDVHLSRGGWVSAVSDDDTPHEYAEIKPRFDSDGYGPIQLKTFKQDVFIPPHWNKGGGIYVEQRAPLPLTILSISPEYDVGG